MVVWKLDRLGRDIKHLIQLMDELNNRGIGLMILSGVGSRIDTTTASGKMMIGFFAVLAEFERDLIIERTRAGLAAARARGRKGGRPRKMDKATIKMALAAMSDRNSVAVDVAKRLRITTTTLYMYVNGNGSPKEIAAKILETKENM
jgi:DNA invertase Pin-like site-specific DNA recombinase